MNTVKLKQYVFLCGKTKGRIAQESGISRVTLDSALQGGDIRVSVLEAIAAAVGCRVGDLFDDPPALSMFQSGSHNTQVGASSVTRPDPDPAISGILERLRALEDAFGKFSANGKTETEKH